MADIIKPGFRGFAEIDGSSPPARLRFNSCSLNAVQGIEAPDMVMGDDTHDAWAYGKIEVGGSLSGPVTESTGRFIDLVDEALTTGGVQINVKYYEGYTRGFTGCHLNSFTFNVTAGDIAQFTLEIIGKTKLDVDPTMASGYTKGEKLVTWDKASIRIWSGANPNGKLDEDADWSTIYDTLDFQSDLSAFSFTASNNISRQFILGVSDLFGDLVEGMKKVTGNISSYTIKTSDGLGAGANYWGQYEGDYAFPIRFDIGNNLSVNAGVRFHRSTADLGIGPVISTINFEGVTTHGRGDIVIS